MTPKRPLFLRLLLFIFGARYVVRSLPDPRNPDWISHRVFDRLNRYDIARYANLHMAEQQADKLNREMP